MTSTQSSSPNLVETFMEGTINFFQTNEEILPPQMDTGDKVLFPHREAMIKGSFKECFYCGSHRHDLKACPSKHLRLASKFFTKLGYLSIERLRACFGQVCSDPEQYNETIANFKETDVQAISSQNEAATAYHVFFDLTEVFQLRFLKRVWQTESTTWNMLDAAPERREEGGPLWLALDCIRVGQIDRAAQFLNMAEDKQANDYRLHTVAGLLQLEKGKHLEALYRFARAKEVSDSNLQRMHVLFIIARLHELLKEYDRAEESINEILSLDRECIDALYYRIIIQIKGKLDGKIIAKLQDMIAQQHEFFLYALIDPRLLPVQKLVDPLLGKMLEETQREIKDIVKVAEEKVQVLTRWLDEENEICQANKALIDKIGHLLEHNSYLGYIEAKDIAQSLIHRCHQTQKNLATDLQKEIAIQSTNLKKYEVYWGKYPLKDFFKKLGHLLQQTRQKLNHAQELMKSTEPEAFKQVQKIKEEAASELSEMSPILGRLEFYKIFFKAMCRFGNRLLVFEIIALLAGLFVIPLASFFITQFYPQLDLNVFNDIGHYLKRALPLSGLAGLLAATMATLKDIYYY